jgi:hypothetical protein
MKFGEKRDGYRAGHPHAYQMLLYFCDSTGFARISGRKGEVNALEM